MNLIKSKNFPLLIAFVISLVSFIFVIAFPLGIADGGSSYKLLEKFGLMYSSAPSGSYFSPYYMFKNGVPFDTRILALVFYVLFINGLLTFVRAISNRGEKNLSEIFAFVAALILCDFCYMLYFTTFYREAALFVCLILSVSVVALTIKHKNVHKWCAMQFLIFASAFALLGLDAAIVAIIIAITFIAISTKCYHGKIAGIISGFVVIAVGVFTLFSVNTVNYKRDLYSSVFLGVAQTASVEEIGLNPELDVLKNTFYSEKTDEEYVLDTRLYDKVSYLDIAGFYLTNPKAFFTAFKTSAANGFSPRPSYLGNYTSGEPGEQANYFAFYSIFKSKFVPNNSFFVFFMFALYFGVLFYILKNEKEKAFVVFPMIMLGVAAVTAFFTPYLISGIYELGRTMFLFNVLFDLMLISSVTAGTRYMLERRNKIREKFGTTQ